MSMTAIYDAAPGAGRDRTLLVMLPGAKARAQDFVEHGFVRQIRERRLALDVVAVDANLGHYLERTFNTQLAHDIIGPALAGGNRRIWLMGISLGGMGALTYAREHPAQIDGVILIAPFLATRGMIAEVTRAGGWSGWLPGIVKSDDDERQLLAWIKAYRPGSAGMPDLHLGYGTDDIFADASKLLAQRLPAGHVVSIAGDHDWTTWSNLWQRLLERDLFGGDISPARATVPINGDDLMLGRASAPADS